MISQSKNLLLLCGLSLSLPACAPSLPMLAIGAATYIAQTQFAKPQEAPMEPSVKKKAAVSQPREVASPVTKKSARQGPVQCRRVDGGTECTMS